MQSEAQEVLRQFRQGLSGLRENDKNKINKLTFLARDHAHIPEFPQSVVEATVRHVYEIPANYKLLGLYVIDSIVKNVNVPYRKLFTDAIVPLFVHSFQMIRDEATRKRLFNLRTTWKEIFPFSKMRSLDVQVREHDPAWPLIPKDETQVTNRIPSVPKISPTKINDKPLAVATSQLTIPVTEAVIAEARDPRRNKKRKSPQHECAESSFLIDRDGNRKMESIARKYGKVEEEVERQASKKPRTLFSLEDQDMRSVPSVRPSSPKLSDHGKHQDVDMRVGGGSQSSSMPRGGSRLPPSSPHTLTHSTTVDSVHLPRVASAECLPHRNPPSLHPRPPMHGPPPHFHRVGPQMIPHRPSPEHPIPPPPPTVFNRPHNVPPIRGPMWSVEIDGLSDMINIGIDPRMLSRVPNPKTPRQITVDGRQYPLLLDRVQPLIEVEDQLHAVRFRCDSLAFIIDHQRFVIPGTGYTRIRAAGRERIAYLGGPGHELVIDGRPHTIPFNSHYATINIDHQTVSVMYACEFPQDVNVLPAIPPKILDWAYRGLFGSPGSLHLAPRNPLVELERQSESRLDSARNDQLSTARSRQPQIAQKSTPPEEKRVQERNPGAPKEGGASSTAATIPQINVQELLQKLIAAGIVAKPDSLPNLKEYNWEKFRQPFTPEIDTLYSGFQCVQCGVRFESETSSDFISHLDYHYMKNSAEHQEHRSRAFYQDKNCWLLSETTNEGAPRFSVPANTTEGEEVRCPSFADEKLNECAVCGYKFDKVFDREEGEWMLQGAVVENGKAYHPICLEDAGKQFPVEAVAPVSGSSTSHGVLKRAEEQQQEEWKKVGGSVSPAPSTSQLSVPIKSEPHIIETKDTIDTFNFSSSRDASDRLPSSSSCPVLSEITNVKREEEEEVKAGEAKGDPATLPLLLSPSSIPSAPVKCEMYQEEQEANLGANSSPVVNIPGLSPTPSLGISSCDDDLTTGGLGGGDGGGSGSVDVGDALVTPASISSNPLAVLQAVLRGKAAIP